MVIEQGRPGGFLLWQPTVAERTGIERDELRPVAVERVEEEISVGSLDDAQTLVDNLERTTTDDDGSDADAGGATDGGASPGDRTPTTTEGRTIDKPGA